jgi:hypothetical protein
MGYNFMVWADYSIIVGGYVVIVLSDTSHRYNPANSSSGSPPLKCTLCVQRTDSAGQRPLGPRGGLGGPRILWANV